MTDYALSDTDRRLNTLIRLGKVVAADYNAARVKVAVGDAETAWLPWIVQRAWGDQCWWPLEVGEQVVVLSPSGDLASGVVLGSIYQNTSPAPENNVDVSTRVHADGAEFKYDRQGHQLDVILPPDAIVNLTAPHGVVTIDAGDGSLSVKALGGVVIEGDTSIDGDVTTTGDITSSGDHVASNISLVNHVHGGVQPGTGTTGLPQ